MRLTCADIKSFKNRLEKFVCLTAYTTPMAQSLVPYVDLVLVGDSVGTVLYGLPDTTGVTLEMMLAHGSAVMRASPDVPVIVDMPYGTYEAGPDSALENARKIMDITGCHGVKLEGGVSMSAQISALVRAGIPVMGHVGLQPQSVVKEGGYKVKGKQASQITALLADIEAVETAGAFAVVIEGTVAAVAEQMTRAVDIPTIGIGASPVCDGQILVTDDLVGSLYSAPPKFVTPYAHVRGVIEDAVERFAADVRAGRFPRPENLYKG